MKLKNIVLRMQCKYATFPQGKNKIKMHAFIPEVNRKGLKMHPYNSLKLLQNVHIQYSCNSFCTHSQKQKCTHS